MRSTAHTTTVAFILTLLLGTAGWQACSSPPPAGGARRAISEAKPTRAHGLPHALALDASAAAHAAGCEIVHPVRSFALVGPEAFLAGGSAIVAIHTETGARRIVSCVYNAPDVASGNGKLIVFDGDSALWQQSTTDGSRHLLAADAREGYAILSGETVSAAGAAQDGSTTLHATGDGRHVRSLAQLMSFSYQRALVGADERFVFVARQWKSSESTSGVELARVPLGGGPARGFYATDSRVGNLVSESGWVVWYEDGYRSSEWGGQYARCRLMAMRGDATDAKARPRVVVDLEAPGHDFCDVDVTFLLDGAFVVYRTSLDQALFRQPLAGGPRVRVAAVPRDAVGLARDGRSVYWISPAGTLDRATLP